MLSLFSQNSMSLGVSSGFTQQIMCSLSYPDKRNIVARGEIHLSSQRQLIHGVSLQDDCYKVSILEMVKKDSYLPHETDGMKTVEDAFKSFVAWPKYVVKTDAKVQNVKPSKVVKTPTDNDVALGKQVLKSAVKLVNVPVVQLPEGNEAVVKLVLKTVVKSVTKADVKPRRFNVVESSNKRKITYIANGTLAKRTRNSTLNKLKE